LCKTSSLGVTTTSFIEKGDIYCVKLTSIPGAYAWIQFTTVPSLSDAPSFVFRVNKTLPYYAYDETSPDAANSCSTSW